MSEETVSSEKQKNNKVKIVDIIFYCTLFLIFAFAFFTTTFWFSSVKVLQTSMLPTFNPNDIIMLDKLSSYSRGDVIVFARNENEDYIKRVIAVEGDTVYSINGEVFVEYTKNGEIVIEKLNETYLNEPTSTYLQYDFGVGIVDIPRTTVTEGCIYVLGDNRRVSVDSRDFGLVEKSTVKGVVHDFWIKNKSITTSIFNFFENIFTSCKN